MKPSIESIGISNEIKNSKRKWYNNLNIWTIIVIIIIVSIIIIITTVLLIKKISEKNNATHIHYTRINTNIYSGNYELYQLNVLSTRNPKHQYKLLANFIRLSLFNRSTYEELLPNCPIIFAMSSVDHPDDWRGMLFGTVKFPRKDMPYPYVCFLSVMPNDRRHKLGSILLNQFINEMTKNTNPSVTHIQLHTNWENCRAQTLYNRCGFRCNEFTAHGYSKPFEPEYQFGHMIRMELNMANIHDLKTVCNDSLAVKISKEDEETYTKLCDQNLPYGINRTCQKTI